MPPSPSTPPLRFEDLDLGRQYTYADYLSWRFHERVELLRGWVTRMSPAHSFYHQQVASEIHVALYDHLRGNPGIVVQAPVDVRLLRTSGGETVVQPDIIVVCDPSAVVNGVYQGAPTMVIEILSPGNTRRELRDKFELYEEAGVGEYWIVDSQRRSVERYVLREGVFVGLPPRTEDDDDITATVLEGFRISGKNVFP